MDSFMCQMVRVPINSAGQVRPATGPEASEDSGSSSVWTWSRLVLLPLGHMSPHTWEDVLEKST